MGKKVSKSETNGVAEEVTTKVTKKIKSIRTYIISGILFIILLTPTILLTEMRFSSQDSREQEIPLLLNSGSLAGEKATVKYILWTEDSGESTKIDKILQSSGLVWDKITLSDYAEKKAYKYITQIEIKKENEGQAIGIYTLLFNKIEGIKARLYFEERVDSALDYDSYLTKSKIDIRQRVQLQDLISISGFHHDLLGIVKAGKQDINIQIVTGNGDKSGKGRTVLAIPALFEEY